MVPSSDDPELFKVLSFKPGVDRNVALRAPPTAEYSVFLISAFLVRSTPFLANFLQHVPSYFVNLVTFDLRG